MAARIGSIASLRPSLLSCLVCFPSTARCLVPISLPMGRGHLTDSGPFNGLLCEFNERKQHWMRKKESQV